MILLPLISRNSIYRDHPTECIKLKFYEFVWCSNDTTTMLHRVGTAHIIHGIINIAHYSKDDRKPILPQYGPFSQGKTYYFRVESSSASWKMKKKMAHRVGSAFISYIDFNWKFTTSWPVNSSSIYDYHSGHEIPFILPSSGEKWTAKHQRRESTFFKLVVSRR